MKDLTPIVPHPMHPRATAIASASTPSTDMANAPSKPVTTSTCKSAAPVKASPSPLSTPNCTPCRYSKVGQPASISTRPSDAALSSNT